MTDIVGRLRSPEVLITNGQMVSPVANEAADEIERLRAALEPFSRLFLYPDDLGLEYAEDIRADDDWCEDANDMQEENVFVFRKYIRAARAALEGK